MKYMYRAWTFGFTALRPVLQEQ